MTHNYFRKSLEFYVKNDPHLSNLEDLKYIFSSPLEHEIPLHIPGIYILTGGRQVGKSTLLKLIIKNLLIHKRVKPQQISYLLLLIHGHWA